MADEIGYTYRDYMDMLTSCVAHLSSSREKSGRYSASLRKLLLDLKNDDPFISYRASKAAIQLMRNKNIYH